MSREQDVELLVDVVAIASDRTSISDSLVMVRTAGVFPELGWGVTEMGRTDVGELDETTGSEWNEGSTPPTTSMWGSSTMEDNATTSNPVSVMKCPDDFITKSKIFRSQALHGFMFESFLNSKLIRRVHDSDDAERIDSYLRVAHGIGEGTYSSVDLLEKITRGSEAIELFAVKSVYYSSLRSTQVAVYGPQGLVDVRSGEFQISREMKILEELSLSQCEHIISIHEILVDEDIIHIIYPYRGYTIMTYCDIHQAYSASTEGRIDNFRTMSVGQLDPVHVLRIEDATECMRQLLRAVAVIHGTGVCHKDIKPDNVLIKVPFSSWWSQSIPDRTSHLHISPNPSPIHVTLCDFNTAEFTQDGGKIYDAQGTVLFSPPEVFTRVFSDEQSIDASPRDMWSVGMVGFALLCGNLPLVGKTPLEIQLELIGMVHEDSNGNIALPRDLESVPNSAPIKLIIESMLSMDPQARPSAKQALDSLR